MILVAKGLAYGAILTVAMMVDVSQLAFPVGTMLTIGGGIWYLGRKLQNVDDRLTTAEEWRREAKVILESLPCRNHCPVETRPKKKTET